MRTDKTDKTNFDKHEFTCYIAERHGIHIYIAEAIVDIFADSLQELISNGASVEIDQIGKFYTIPLFPAGIKHNNNFALAKAAREHMVGFKASNQLKRYAA